MEVAVEVEVEVEVALEAVHQQVLVQPHPQAAME